MKQLFKIALIAMATLLPFDEAEACSSCGPTQVWVDAYQDGHGHYHAGHWEVTQLCRQPVPVRRQMVVIRPLSIRIGSNHRSHNTHHGRYSSHRYSSTHSHSTNHRSRR